ncbi:MAG: TIGR02996 domain-containing protein [Deltaproteobacteria bacterium]|nr:TIGR02996 domain-containing protein [Deltaproteobacteria bacterium]
MTVEAELIAAIAAAPADDEPRLVYADQLMQQGDPRGEFIALQCRIAKADAVDEPIDEAVITRERELRETHGVLWLAPLREIVDAAFVFRRGFVEHVYALSESDITYWQPTEEGEPPYYYGDRSQEPNDRLEQLAAALPLLRSIATRGDVIRCVIGPAWSRLHAVELLSPRAAVPQIEAFVRAPERQSIRRLQLTNTEADDDQARAWLGLPQRLEHLGFHIGVNVTSRPTCDVAALIAENSALHGLRSLHLGNVPLVAKSLGSLPRLESLALHRNAITARDLVELVAKLPALTALEFDNDDQELGKLDLAELLAAAPTLTRLAIHNCSASARALATSQHSLRRIELDQCHLDPTTVTALLDNEGVRWWRVVDDGLTPDLLAPFAERHQLHYQAPPPPYPRDIVEQLPRNKIAAIKIYRQRTSAGLADSKMEIERIDEELGQKPTYGFQRAVPRWCRP